MNTIAPDDVPLVLRPHPFSQDPGFVPVKSGQTIQQMLDQVAEGREICATLRVEVGGYEVPRELWARVRPKAGTALHVTVMPAGSDKAKKWLRTILLIIVIVVALYISGGAFGTELWGLTAAQAGMAVAMIGSLVVNALIPPPMPKLEMGGAGGSEAQKRLNVLTGTNNRINPYGVIPLVIGEARIFPPHAAMPYSESLGMVSYQRLMFDLGHGELEAADMRIGNTTITSYADVDTQVSRDPTLYASDVHEQSVSVAMNDFDTAVRTTAPDIDVISIDLAFLQGLFAITQEGGTAYGAAQLNIAYRQVGTTEWQPLTGVRSERGVGITIAAGRAPYAMDIRPVRHKNPFVASYAWTVLRGQYEVQIKRGGTVYGSNTLSQRISDATWTVLRSFKHTNPSRTGTMKLAVFIKASEQLQGTLDTLSCLARQKIRSYNRVTKQWSLPAVNLNPAWVVYWLMTECPALTTHVKPERIDLNSFCDFADFCTQHDFEVRGVLDSPTTARQLIDDVLACSLGALSMRDGKYGILFDRGLTVPSMVFTPHDIRNFSVARSFPKIPHALRVRFKNPVADWQQDEIVVLDDKHSFRGMGARGELGSALPEATEFETMDIRFAADAHQAWRVGRHHFAQALFRPNVYSWETDIANLAVTRGDLVHVAHDVVEWGDGWGRVKSLVGDVLTIDERITITPGISYSVRVRRDDGTSVVAGCAPVRRNLLLNTERVAPGTGLWSMTRVTSAENVTESPFGGNTADLLREDTSVNSTHYATKALTVVQGSAYTVSAYVKAAGRTRVALGHFATNSGFGTGTTSAAYTIFDLQTVSAIQLGLTCRNASIEDVGGGWFRISATCTATASVSGAVGLLLCSGTGAPVLSYTGDGVSGVYVWGMQAEVSEVASEYQRVDAAVVGSPHGESSFTLAAPLTGVQQGDVAVLGETNQETKVLLVTGIYPAEDLSARITAVEYDSRVLPFWSNPPTTITSEVTGNPLNDPPPPPNITVVISDAAHDEPDDGGITRPGVRIGIQQPPSGPRRPRRGGRSGNGFENEFY